ncbi:3'-5' exonuclease [Ligilactobacillus acidipiscis]|jgi:DNA polymerase-3 subunit epsilon|uniref:DNA polymerase III polC-type n=1 Tax=Ligilactobacillus acidipiscis TaxID=89059 RepID=A0A921F6Y3_9LACO|nr:3'-5' exonuclease [Ligilactobacillus acidipiscis]MCI1925318.1 3'-5' exonuclease [Ligilactobacillus acidipiscis]MCI1954699.1 3'-5' exonuclease [Ligilactobacillus acidipiscis]WEV57802.1 3'-5' exonuclease [Ligilactobacillus acidipiscis]HJE96500.1 3'-5' exonuclease [Ligilactobacillus acidipiscis]
MDFIALDFETASPKRHSACSLALTVVRNDQVIDEMYSLIKPATEFSPNNIRIHGITPQDVANSPTFPQLWPHISSFFGPQKLIVAHNASFDVSVLRKTLGFYKLPVPNFMVLDTLKTSRQLLNDLPNYQLNTVCDFLSISLKHHHNALADSRACAQILISEAQQYGTEVLKPLIRAY